MDRMERGNRLWKLAGVAVGSLALWLGAATVAQAGSYLELGSFDANNNIRLGNVQYTEGSTYDLFFSTDAGQTWTLWKNRTHVFRTDSESPTILDLGLGTQEKGGTPEIAYSLGNGDAAILQSNELASAPGYFRDVQIVWNTPGFGYSLTTESVLSRGDGIKAVPLPATALLFASFLGGLGLFGRRKG